MLLDIFVRIEGFFKRLESYTEVRPTAAMTDVIVKIMIEVLSILAIATKEIKQGRSSELIDVNKLLFSHLSSGKFLKKLLGKNNIEDALKKLDTLTMEEARLAIAETLKVTNRVEGKVDKVDDTVNRVDDKVDKVDNTVNRVDDKVDNVDDKVGKVDSKVDKVDETVNRVDNKVDKVDDKVDKVDDKVDKVDDKVDKVDNKVMVLIGGRESLSGNLRIPEHAYDSKRTRETTKLALSSGSVNKS